MHKKITAENISWDNYLLSQASKETVIEVVSKNGNMLQYASLDMINDKEVVLAAVSNNGMAIRFASSRLKGDPDVIFTAVRQKEEAFQFVSFELRNNWNFVLFTMKINGMALKYASNKLKGDEDVAWEAVCQNRESLRFVSESIRDYVESMLEEKERREYTSEKLQEEVFQKAPETRKEMNPEELESLLTDLEGNLDFLDSLNMADMSMEEKLEYLKKKNN